MELDAYVGDIGSVVVVCGSCELGGKENAYVWGVWMVFPNTRKHVGINSDQQLMVKVANNNIAKMNLSENYNLLSMGITAGCEEHYFIGLVTKERKGWISS